MQSTATAVIVLKYFFDTMNMKENVTAADWESGAVAMICKANSIPCTIIRGITDIPSENPDPAADTQGNDYIKNTPVVMKRMVRDILLKLI